MFKGSIVALVTPFTEEGIDLKSVASLVDMHLQSGTAGIVAAGTTGEAPTLTAEEFFRLVKAIKDECAGKIPVIAGVGTNSTVRTIERAKAAAEAGADALLVVSPYYNKPTQEGLARHFEAVAGATQLPLVLYNIPGRCAVVLQPDTLQRLARCSNIVAIKQATGNVETVTEIRARCNLAILSGEDSLTLPMMALGAVGVISVAANLVPREVASMVDRALSGDWTGAREMHEKLFPLFRACFLETNPIPVKTALALMGRIPLRFRLPLCEMGKERESRLRQVLREHGLIS